MKSFFTKLGTLLLCGVAVAVVGCTDFSQDIQAGDAALKGEIERVEKSTASTIAELKASISALEAAQKKIEAEYAKQSDLEAAKKALQDAIDAEVADLNAAISAINTTLDGKADKSAVEALQKTMADAIAEANKTIANLEAAQEALEAELAKKADKADTDKVAADVEILKNGYQETALALTELQNALNGKASQEDLELTQNALKTVTADVESLKQAYMEIVAGFQQFQADLASKASQADMELAQKDIKDLKTASAEATFAIANLSTAVDVIEARVDGIENELNKAKEQIAQQTTQLTNLATALEQAKGDLEAEAELREAADEALQTEVAQLVYGLTNLQGAYEVHIQEYEAYKDALKKQIDDLAAQDGALANSIISYYDQAIAAVEESEAALKTLVEEEIAKVTNLIAQERTEIEGMIAYVEESFAKADEELFTLVQDSLITVVYNTIYNYDSKYEAMFATVDEQIAAMDEEFRFILNSLAQQDSTLDAMISAVDADLQAKYAEAMMAVVTNRTEIEGMIAYMDEELKGLIAGLTERVEKLENKVNDLDEQTAALEEAVVALQGAHATLTEQLQNKLTVLDNQIADLQESTGDNADAIAKLQEAHAILTEQLQNKLSVIDDQIEALNEAIEDNKKAIEKNGAAIEDNAELIAENAELITETKVELAELQGNFKAFVQNVEIVLTNHASSIVSLTDELDGVLEVIEDINADIDGIQEDLTAAIGRIDALEDAVATIQEAYAVLIEGLQNKFGATDKEIADLQDANDALKKALAEEVKKLYDNDQKNLDNLSDRLASHTDKLAKMIYAVEERLGKAEGKIADLEEQTAALETAIKNLQDAHALLEYNLQQKLSDLDKALEAIDETHKDDVKALQDAHALLSAQLEEALGRINGQIETLQEAVADNKNAIKANGAAIEDNKELIAKNAADILETNTVIAELQAAFEAYKKATDAQIQYLWNNDSSIAENLARHTDKLMGLINETNASLDKTQEDLTAAIGRIDALEDAVEALEELAATLASKEYTDSEIKRIEDKATAIQNMLLTFITAAEDRANDKIDHLRTLVAEADELIKGLRGDVDKLIARVQSMVFVPKYSDNMATIKFIKVRSGNGDKETNEGGRYNSDCVPAYSVLTYKIHATNAKEIAAAIEKNPSLVKFDLVSVETRSTGADAGLKVISVKAEDNLIHVTVLPENFTDRFYLHRDSDDGRYSVALVLSNNESYRSSEYTNLVPDMDGEYTLAIVDADEKPYNDVETRRHYHPYDKTEQGDTLLDNHKLVLIKDNEAFELAPNYDKEALGDYFFDIHYDFVVNHGSIALTLADRPVDGTDRLEFQGHDFKFDQAGDRDFIATPTRAFTKEDKGKVYTYEVKYRVNDLDVTEVDQIEITNKLVEYTFDPIKIDWTLEVVNELMSEGKLYNENIVRTLTYPSMDTPYGESTLADLFEGYTFKSILSAHTDKRFIMVNGVEVNDQNVLKASNVTEKDMMLTLSNTESFTYAFPKNNNDEVTDWNKYTITYHKTFEAIDVHITVPVWLGEQAPAQLIKAEKVFKPGKNADKLYGYWNAVEQAYNEFNAAGYVGYADNAELGKSKFAEAFANISSYGNSGDMPLVNGVKGFEDNVNIPFTNDKCNAAGEHRFQLRKSQMIAKADKDGYLDGTTHSIVQKVGVYFGIPFTFELTAKVDLPDYALDLDEVYAPNGIVDVKGEITGEAPGKYLVDVSDLALYYYVVNSEGTKSLTRVNEYDNLNVKFELSGMEGTTETGYFIEGGNNTLPVDFSKEAPYMLEQDKAVVNWGTYPHTEVGVMATLEVNGFPIAKKPVTLVTQDPLKIALNNVTVNAIHKAGTNEEPTVAKIYQNFELTSSVQPEYENLFNVEAKTLAGLFYYSKADQIYKITLVPEVQRVYYKDADENVKAWDADKIVFGTFAEDKGAYKKGDFDGSLHITADDANIKTPIYVDVKVTMTHNIHDGAKEVCETVGTVTVTFLPEGWPVDAE